MPEVVASGARWRVERDEDGIARCVGRGLDDLAYAQGWACAHDRAWQVETDRRRSTGGLADWLGDESCRPVDELASRARLDALALRCWARVVEEEPEVAAWLQAYVDGVNDGMQVGAARSPEMAAARVQPGRWAPWSPIGIFLVNHVLFGSYPHELWREHVEGTLGGRWADVLAPAHGHPALSGSNAWAVTPSRSATGAPLLAADPHRLLECPGIYQQVHLVAEDDGVDVLGLAFPGVPGVPHFGHTGDVAWVITNAMAHYQELVDDGPLADEATDRPVVLDPVAGRPARRLRTPAWVGSRVGVRAWRDLLLSGDVEDVDAALEHWVEPVNAVLVADSTGQVIERVAGLTAAGPTTRTTRVVPDGSVAVHANHASALTAPWGRAFAPDHRARRVELLLEPHDQVTLDDCAQIQRDAVSGSWPVVRGLLARPAVGRGPRRRRGAGEGAAARLRRGDGRGERRGGARRPLPPAPGAGGPRRPGAAPPSRRDGAAVPLRAVDRPARPGDDGPRAGGRAGRGAGSGARAGHPVGPAGRGRRGSAGDVGRAAPGPPARAAGLRDPASADPGERGRRRGVRDEHPHRYRARRHPWPRRPGPVGSRRPVAQPVGRPLRRRRGARRGPRPRPGPAVGRRHHPPRPDRRPDDRDHPAARWRRGDRPAARPTW